jgi:hypothetical protein
MMEGLRQKRVKKETEKTHQLCKESELEIKANVDPRTTQPQLLGAMKNMYAITYRRKFVLASTLRQNNAEKPQCQFFSSQ